MIKYNKVKYSYPFLKQVIVRVDFLEFLETNNVFMTAIENIIKDFYPNNGKNHKIRFKPDYDPTKTFASLQEQEGMQREYYDTEKCNKLILSNKFIVFEVNKYKSFKELIDCVQTILAVFFAKNKVTPIRTGMRYINIFDANKIKLQKNYFSSEIATTLAVNSLTQKNGLNQIRSMHLMEYNIANMNVNFRYGMFNPEYPAVLKKNSFTLDLDCVVKQPLSSFEEVLYCLTQGHDTIQMLFEESISDNLRKVMNNGIKVK